MKTETDARRPSGRIGFILAVVAYGIWLGFLAVLAVIQKVR